MLLRFAYLAVTSVFALLRLLLVSDRDKDVEILALRHQIAVPERQLGTTRPWFCPGGRAFPAALPHRLPSEVPGRAAAPLRPLPEPIAGPERIAQLDVRRRDRLVGALHEYRPLPDQHG